MKLRRISLLSLLVILLVALPITNVQAQTTPVVHAVLFYSPSCGHCHFVISETLPPLFEKYGEQLQMIGVDVSQPNGQTLFMETLKKFGQESGGVPFLVIGDTFLVGSLDIPEKFPGLIEQYLALGGVDWPDIPGMQEALTQPNVNDPTTATQPEPTVQSETPEPGSGSQAFALPTETPGLILPDDQNSSWLDNFSRDLAGNTLAVIVLAGMLACVAWAVFLFQKTNGVALRGNWSYIIPVLCMLGLGVAGYLAYVETMQVTAVCGPVGDCNTVQQSEYARLFGILPIGVLGLFGYVAIIAAWLIARQHNDRLAGFATISLFGMAAFGTLFSIYLTFLEPFVIGATCAWCLTSAVLMTLLMLLSVGPAKLALSKHRFKRSYRPRYSRIRRIR